MVTKYNIVPMSDQYRTNIVHFMYKPKMTVVIVVYFINCVKTAKRSGKIRPISYLFIAVVIWYSLLKMAAEKRAWRNRKWSKSGSLSLLTTTNSTSRSLPYKLLTYLLNYSTPPATPLSKRIYAWQTYALYLCYYKCVEITWHPHDPAPTTNLWY